MAGYRETIKQVLDGDFSGASEEEKKEAIRKLIQASSIAAGALTVQPFPFVDSALIAPIQIAMVQGIGRVHGVKLDQKSVVEILSTLGASIVAQNLAIAAAKLIPFLGSLVGVSMAYALTWAIGDTADYYFRNGRGVSPDSLKDMFKRTYKTKKEEKQEQHRGNNTLKDKLEQLTQAHKAGLLSEEEFNAKKEELLRNF